ncbi:hypothetical protein [Frankia sp. Cj3]|nr:hypothetical protein [Frankia sp. Cj3]
MSSSAVMASSARAMVAGDAAQDDLAVVSGCPAIRASAASGCPHPSLAL